MHSLVTNYKKDTNLEVRDICSKISTMRCPNFTPVEISYLTDEVERKKHMCIQNRIVCLKCFDKGGGERDSVESQCSKCNNLCTSKEGR